MLKKMLVSELQGSREFFERSSRCLTEEDSEFRPGEGLFTVAHQMAHVAQTIDWFLEGASRPEGFDLDFEKHSAALQQTRSVAAAREWVQRSYAKVIEYFEGLSDEDLMRPLPPGPVMGGAPLLSIVGAIVDHSAHHRGALTVYSRMKGRVPLMPYGEVSDTASA